VRAQDHHVDLYLRPPHIGSYKLMDYHLMHRIVRDSYRCGHKGLGGAFGSRLLSLALRSLLNTP